MNTGARFIQVLSSLFGVIAVGMPIFLGFYILNQDSEISSQYIVNTGMRTRDREHPYLLPVPSPENDAYARMYGCMMDAEIARGPLQCKTQESIEDFEACIRTMPSAMQCDQYINGNDYDFLKCIQRNYNVTTRQTNVFLECQSLSQPATFISTQNAGSTVFLGSYNYAVLLVNALTIIASFVVFTAGGWFYEGSVSRYPEKENHIYGVWSPFSAWRVYVAWVWNLVAFLFAVVIAFNNMDINAANREDVTKRFPVTLWTCMLSIGSFAVALAFYTYYAFEWVFAGTFGFLYAGSGDSSKIVDNEDNTIPPAVIPSGIPSAVAGMFHPSGRRRYAPQTFNTALTRRFTPLSPWRRGVGGGYLGVQLYGDVASDAEIKAEHVMPLYLQAFAWTWVLTDGLFFVGMLTSQSSINNESVVRVFYSITAGRLFQLAGAYMAYKVYISDIGDDTLKLGMKIASGLVHFASLFCIGIASAEFMSTYEFARVASLPTSGFPSYSTIQWVFIVIVVILPETLRIINFFSAILPATGTKYSDEFLLMMAEGLFTWEWMARLILAIITIIPLSNAIKDQQNTLINFMITTA